MTISVGRETAHAKREDRMPTDARGWLVELVDRCAAIATRLGLPQHEALAADVHELIDQPTQMYAAHPNWPSAMSVVGPPIEISLRLDPGKPPALRFVTDTTDHAHGLSENWNRYVSKTAAVIGGDNASALARQLCRVHLNAVPAQYRSRALHGISYGAEPDRRGTVYFRNRIPLNGASVEDPQTGDLPELPALAASAISAGCPASELVGYDFREGAISRIKLFCPIGRETTRSLLDVTEPDEPDLGAASSIANAFWERSRRAQLFCALQCSTAGDDVSRKLYFSCPAWGWQEPAGLLELVHLLTNEMSVDLEPLGSLMDTLPSPVIGLAPGFVAVSGPPDRPSVSFYFSPTMRRPQGFGRLTAHGGGGRSPEGRRASVGRLIDAGLAYLAGAQERDGQWSDFETESAIGAAGSHIAWGRSNQLVTALVAASLLNIGEAAPMVSNAARALDHWGAGGRDIGWNDRSPPDSEATGLALLVLSSAEIPAKPLSQLVERAHRCSDAEALSAFLLALNAAGGRRFRREADASDEPAVIRRSLTEQLVSLQAPDGRWTATRWASSLVATIRTAAALATVPDTSTADIRASALSGAAQALMAWPLPADPLLMGLWLQGWAAVGGEPENHSVQRIVNCLVEGQLSNGTWASAPCRRIPRLQGSNQGREGWTGAYDPVCVDHGTVTCAIVIAGLQSALA